MKAIFKVSGFLKLPGKTTHFAHHQSEIEIDARTTDLEMKVITFLRPQFSFKDAMMIDRVEKEIVLEGEINTAEKCAHLLVILNVKEFTKLDISKLKISDDLIPEFSAKAMQALKTNFVVQEINMPLSMLRDKQMDEYLVRNKAMKKLMPWYSNPLKNSSPLKLTLAFLGVAFVGSWIGLGILSLFSLSALYVLGAQALSHQKEKALQTAWIAEQQPDMSDDAVAAKALGLQSREDWKSYGQALIPSHETLAASYTSYYSYLAGALTAEMEKVKAQARPEAPPEELGRAPSL
jgi:hypothetical protein